MASRNSKPYSDNQVAALKRERAALHGRGLDERVALVEDELKAAGVNKGDLDKLPTRRRTAAQGTPTTPPAGQGGGQTTDEKAAADQKAADDKAAAEKGNQS